MSRNITHGMEGTRLYKIWDCMKQRCTNPNNPQYKHYGGRGIQVCSEWLCFAEFMNWAMANGYDESLSIDRRDNNEWYTPENCRWVTQKIQNNNKRNNHLLSFNGTTRTIAEWGKVTGFLPATIQHRIVRDGWTVEDALTIPPKKGNRIKKRQ